MKHLALQGIHDCMKPHTVPLQGNSDKKSPQSTCTRHIQQEYALNLRIFRHRHPVLVSNGSDLEMGEWEEAEKEPEWEALDIGGEKEAAERLRVSCVQPLQRQHEKMRR
jgi:hypothetical protein